MSGFKSQAQQRYFYAKGRKNPLFRYYAAKKQMQTGPYHSLPKRRRRYSLTSLRKLF